MLGQDNQELAGSTEKGKQQALQEADEEPLFLLMTSAGDHLFPASLKGYRKIGMLSVLTRVLVMELCAELHSMF